MLGWGCKAFDEILSCEICDAYCWPSPRQDLTVSPQFSVASGYIFVTLQILTAWEKRYGNFYFSSRGFLCCVSCCWRSSCSNIKLQPLVFPFPILLLTHPVDALGRISITVFKAYFCFTFSPKGKIRIHYASYFYSAKLNLPFQFSSSNQCFIIQKINGTPSNHCGEFISKTHLSITLSWPFYAPLHSWYIHNTLLMAFGHRI